jgi:general secretion pathway protein C
MVNDPDAPAGALSRLNHNRRMPARLSAFFVWALVAASAVFWGLRLLVTPPAAPAHTLAVADGAPARVDLTRLFGAPAVATSASTQAPAASSRFQLVGVMAPKVPDEHGIALLAVDGKLPRPYRVGATIDGELVLQSVSLRTASIGPARGAPVVVLEVPPLPVAATGSLPPPASFAPPAAGPVPPMPAAPIPVAPVAPPQPGMPGQPSVTPVMPGGQVAPPPQRSRGMGLTPRDQNQPATTQ